jgi:sulfate permease, SulP family
MRAALFTSLRSYRRRFAGADLPAALTLFVIAVPEQLAISGLGGMPPVTGFYAFVAGTVFFALLGSNPIMSVGADSTIAPLFAVGVSHFAPLGSPRYVDLVGILAVMVGVIVALVGLLRLGWIAEFLSRPIIIGFLAGVAVIIVIHELPNLLGFASSTGSNLHRVAEIARHLRDTNGWALGIGVVVLGIVIAAGRVDRRLPGALVGLVASTIVVAAAGLHAHGVPILGTFAHGAPHLGLEGVSWKSLGDVAPVAGVVALVVVSQTAATSRAFPGPLDEEVDVGRDFLGTGAGSVVAGFAGAFPVDASPARTAAVSGAGGRTQVTGLVAAGLLIALIPAAGLLKDVPLATLAAVLFFVASRLVRLRELADIARFDRLEAALAVITLLTVVLVGVEQGILVAVGLAIVDRARLSARPRLHVLGRIPGTTSWAPLSRTSGAAQEPGVVVVLFATPLWYANATDFRTQVEAALRRSVAAPRLLVLDAIGMGDIDYTGSRALSDVLDHLQHRNVSVAVARCGERVQAELRRSGLLQRIGEDRLFPSVDQAVRSFGEKPPS